LINTQEILHMHKKLDTHLTTQITSNDADDVRALTSIEFSSTGRILWRAILVEIERHRHAIENNGETPLNQSGRMAADIARRPSGALAVGAGAFPMTRTSETRPAGDAAGLGISPLFYRCDNPENKPSNHLIQAQNNLRLKLLASRLHALVRSVAPSLPLLGGLAMNEPSVYAGCPTKRNRASLVEMGRRRTGLLAIVETMRPMTVRQVFYHKVQIALANMRRDGAMPYWIVDCTRDHASRAPSAT
jgi:hypothetical protein